MPSGIVTTGDARFDEVFAVSAHTDAAQATQWLDTSRRNALLALNDQLTILEVDEKELEARLSTTEWEPRQLVEAIKLCVQVASTLNRSFG